jgi:hypothetical protein
VQDARLSCEQMVEFAFWPCDADPLTVAGIGPAVAGEIEPIRPERETVTR